MKIDGVQQDRCIDMNSLGTFCMNLFCIDVMSALSGVVFFHRKPNEKIVSPVGLCWHFHIQKHGVCILLGVYFSPYVKLITGESISHTHIYIWHILV